MFHPYFDWGGGGLREVASEGVNPDLVVTSCHMRFAMGVVAPGLWIWA